MSYIFVAFRAFLTVLPVLFKRKKWLELFRYNLFVNIWVWRGSLNFYMNVVIQIKKWDLLSMTTMSLCLWLAFLLLSKFGTTGGTILNTSLNVSFLNCENYSHKYAYCNNFLFVFFFVYIGLRLVFENLICLFGVGLSYVENLLCFTFTISQ